MDLPCDFDLSRHELLIHQVGAEFLILSSDASEAKGTGRVQCSPVAKNSEALNLISNIAASPKYAGGWGSGILYI